VACPWFEPLHEASSLERPAPARAPLGRLFTGRCHASPGQPVTPDPASHYEACNFGYGRATCSRFPASAEADAVRFSQHTGKLVWILEKNYAPLRHGIVDATTDGLLARQAEVFRNACLNR
jgi:hypothetical protein